MVFNKILEYVNIHCSLGHFNEFCGGAVNGVNGISEHIYKMYLYTVHFTLQSCYKTGCQLCNVWIIAIDGVQLQ